MKPAALARFSSVLLLPLGYLLLTRNSGFSHRGWLDRDPISDPVRGGDRLQRSFAYYMARIFFAP